MIAIAGLLAMTSVLVSCAKAPRDQETGGFSFTDALGRSVRLEKSPERVAALLGSFADIWLLAGGEICASASDAWDDFGLPLDSAVNIGGAHSPSLERLLSADPDFVLASASTASNVEMKETLESMGIAVAYFDVDHFDDYLQMLDICTDITGRKDLYEQNGTRLYEEIESIRTAYVERNVSETENRILLLRASAGRVRVKNSEGTILGEMLCDMGCVNIADRESGLLENLNIESIIQNEPYHIFVVTMGDDTEAAKDALTNIMEENPAWGTLEAVREGRLHFMDRSLFNLKPNLRWAEAYETLYETLIEQP